MLRPYVAASVTLLALAAPAWGQFELDWFTFDGGGAMNVTGGTFKLSGTIGQPDAGLMSGGIFRLTGGFWAGVGGSPVCTGDMNCDGVINFADINPLVAILSGGSPCNFANADCNGDGKIDFKDINAFVALLSSGATCQAVCKGDMNCDRAVNFKDINPFVAILSGGTPCSAGNADCNSDGAIDFKDINAFVALLSGGATCP
jgi:hypothetical protein